MVAQIISRRKPQPSKIFHQIELCCTTFYETITNHVEPISEHLIQVNTFPKMHQSKFTTNQNENEVT